MEEKLLILLTFTISQSERISLAPTAEFQIGYSEQLFEESRQWEKVARERILKTTANLIGGRDSIDGPILSEGNPSDRVKIYAVNGERAIFADPMFKDPSNQDFRLRRGPPVVAR